MCFCSIRVWYGDVAAEKHGGDGGDLNSFIIPEGEWISGIQMYQGEESRDDSNDDNYYVCAITFELYRPEVGDRYL